jgi:hypothetical protein
VDFKSVYVVCLFISVLDARFVYIPVKIQTIV